MENTFTYTARHADNPNKVATFTLQNGSVSIQLGEAMLEQVEHAFDAFHQKDDSRFRNWLRPAATGTLQRILQPIPLTDFDAQMEGKSLQTMAWIRAGGLRLAPVMTTWPEVDNPIGAKAFVKEVTERKEDLTADKTLPDPLDYWFTWLVIGVITVVMPLFWWKKWQDRR